VLAVMALGENLDGVAVQKMYASIRRLAPDGGPITKGAVGVDPSDPNAAVTYPDDAPVEEPVAEPPTEDEPPHR
jgi:hypothetical protein